MLWQCLSEFSCFGNKHCAFESCWDTLAFFTDLLLTPHTRSRLVFIVHLRKENIQISIQCCPSVCHFSLHSIVLFGKKEKQSAEIDNDIYTCRIAKVNINIQRDCHLRMIKGDMLQEERHVAELQCKRQAEKGIQWCMQEEKNVTFKFVALQLVFFTFECQCLEQRELQWVHEKAILSGVECSGGSSFVFHSHCMPKMTSDLIRCLSSSHWLHTRNNRKRFYYGIEQGLKLGSESLLCSIL